jgi:hypothetical protein
MITEKRSDELSPLNRAGITPGSEKNLQALRRVLPTIWIKTITKQIKNMIKVKKYFLLVSVIILIMSGCGVDSEEGIKKSHIIGATYVSDVGDEISFGEEEVFESGERECRASTIPSRANCAYEINYSRNSNDVKYVKSVDIMMHLPFNGRESVEVLNRTEVPVGLDKEGNIYINVEGDRFKRQ